MKIQLDTTNKVIKLENSINLGELVKNLEKILPKAEWKQFTLETNTVINNWNSPVIIREYPQYPHRWDWPWVSSTTENYMSGSSLHSKDLSSNALKLSLKSDYKLQAGVFNVEL